MVERFRRGELRRPLLAVAGALLLAGLTAAGAARAYSLRPDPMQEEGAVWGRISAQQLLMGRRIPGFWLPDSRGGVVRLAPYHGKILLVYLFPADDPDSARLLPVLDAIARDYGSRGVQPVGVCLSPDHADGWSITRTGGYRFPIASDLSTLTTGSPPDAAATNAYSAEFLPQLVVTDRSRAVREVLRGLPIDAATLRRIIDERLAAEPE